MIRMNYEVMTRFSNDYIINERRRAGEETEETHKMTIKRGKERQQNKKSLPRNKPSTTELTKQFVSSLSSELFVIASGIINCLVFSSRFNSIVVTSLSFLSSFVSHSSSLIIHYLSIKKKEQERQIV